MGRNNDGRLAVLNVRTRGIRFVIARAAAGLALQPYDEDVGHCRPVRPMMRSEVGS